MNQKGGERHVYAFIDNQNLNVTIQNLGWKMDWRRFRKYLAERYGVTQAFMFIGYVPEYEDMYEFLHSAGYNIVLKPTFDMTRPRDKVAKPDTTHDGDGEEKKPIKGNVDVELVLWAVKEMNTYDKAIIVSGDGDFYSLVEYLESKGKLKKILTPSGQYSSLYNRYDKYIERLDQHRRQLEYKARHRHTKKPE